MNRVWGTHTQDRHSHRLGVLYLKLFQSRTQRERGCGLQHASYFVHWLLLFIWGHVKSERINLTSTCSSWAGLHFGGFFVSWHVWFWFVWIVFLSSWRCFGFFFFTSCNVDWITTICVALQSGWYVLNNNVLHANVAGGQWKFWDGMEEVFNVMNV